MKYLLLIALLAIFNISHACGFKDYECIKQTQLRSQQASEQHLKRYNQDYQYNERHFVSGRYDNTPVQLTGRYNHNVQVYAHNSSVTGIGNDASIVSIDHNTQHNRVTINATGNIQNTAVAMTSQSVCASLVCNRSHSGKGIIVNINNATVTNTIK